jgi:hypothetical protein
MRQGDEGDHRRAGTEKPAIYAVDVHHPTTQQTTPSREEVSGLPAGGCCDVDRLTTCNRIGCRIVQDYVIDLVSIGLQEPANRAPRVRLKLLTCRVVEFEIQPYEFNAPFAQLLDIAFETRRE